jgi:hypothetical protein
VRARRGARPREPGTPARRGNLVVAHLAWLERRRDEAWAPVAACTRSTFLVAEGGRLMSCGTDDDED